MSSLRIGLFGAGIVGGGAVELIQRNIENGRFSQLGCNIDVAKICVTNVGKKRSFKTRGIVIVTNIDEILNDESINCVIEVMGGITTAKEAVFGAINKGKHVITANKALIAAFLPELQEALARNPTVRFCYEAAVCGGIPIINSLQNDFFSDKITKIMGIMNGTTNFMLSKMEDEGAAYSVVLAEAQRLGFAEADPTADVEGFDVQSKIAILAKLSFGVTVHVESIPTVGISKLDSVDFQLAKSFHRTIKLVGTAQLNSDGTLAVYVSPTMVPLSSPFASAKGPGNLVVVNSDNLTQTTFAGPGAGRFPTANSILNDVIRIARSTASVNPFPLCASIHLNSDYVSKFYIRIKGSHAQTQKYIETTVTRCGLELATISKGGENEYTAVTKEEVKASKIKLFVDSLLTLTLYIESVPVVMPML